MAGTGSIAIARCAPKRRSSGTVVVPMFAPMSRTVRPASENAGEWCSSAARIRSIAPSSKPPVRNVSRLTKRSLVLTQ